MRYYKRVEGLYITAIGIGAGGTELTAAEYEQLRAVIDARPAAAPGCGLRLTEALVWEPYDLQPVGDEELTDAAALEIITGGGQG